MKKILVLMLLAVIAPLKSANATIITSDFVVSGFSLEAPFSTISGSLSWEAESLSDEITSILSVDFSMNGYSYVLSDIGFNNFNADVSFIGGVVNEVLGVGHAGIDDFRLTIDRNIGELSVFHYTAAGHSGVWRGRNFNGTSTSIQGVSEPGTLLLLIIGLVFGLFKANTDNRVAGGGALPVSTTPRMWLCTGRFPTMFKASGRLAPA